MEIIKFVMAEFVLAVGCAFLTYSLKDTSIHREMGIAIFFIVSAYFTFNLKNYGEK